MRYFDYEKVAREAQILPEKLDELSRLMRQDFPKDEMMHELHLLRACMAIRDGVLTVEEALRPEPATRGPSGNHVLGDLSNRKPFVSHAQAP